MLNSCPEDIRAQVRQLTDEYRDRCLWYLRADYFPETAEEMLRCLEAIQRHGDLEAFRKAGDLLPCLLRIIKEPSAGC